VLAYATQGGMSYSDVVEMTRQDREWYIERLSREKEEERHKIDSYRSKNAPKGKGRR